MLVAVIALAGGCADGGDDERIELPSAEALVLQPDDLRAGWEQFDAGPQARTDVGVRPLGDRGREASWKARYRRADSAATSGPLVVESRADLFADDDVAHDDFTEIEGMFDAFLPQATDIDLPELGDESLAATYVEAAADRSVRFYFVAWRHGNVTASLSANGFEGRFALADVLELARAQERRIASAGGSP